MPCRNSFWLNEYVSETVTKIHGSLINIIIILFYQRSLIHYYYFFFIEDRTSLLVNKAQYDALE